MKPNVLVYDIHVGTYIYTYFGKQVCLFTKSQSHTYVHACSTPQCLCRRCVVVCLLNRLSPVHQVHLTSPVYSTFSPSISHSGYLPLHTSLCACCQASHVKWVRIGWWGHLHGAPHPQRVEQCLHSRGGYTTNCSHFCEGKGENCIRVE